MFNLEKSGFNENLILRFDQTLPFMRHACVNKVPREGLVRYSIGPVFRNDDTNQKHGRFRQFEQADFDIATENHSEMVPDVMVVEAMLNGLDKMSEMFDGSNDYKVKINDRRILNKIFEKSGFDETDFLKVAGCLDKLDKTSWEQVEKELSDNGFERIKIGNLKENILNSKIQNSEELKRFFELSSLNKSISDRIEFTPTLARGLDYYTGLIFETFDHSKKIPVSVAGGGRYDNLCSTITSGKVKNIKAVGMSIGVERLMALNKIKDLEDKSGKNSVYIATVPIKEDLERLENAKIELTSRLRSRGVVVKTSFKSKLKLLNQFQIAESLNIDKVLVIGPEEIENGVFKLRTGRDEEKIDDFDVLVNKLLN